MCLCVCDAHNIRLAFSFGLAIPTGLLVGRVYMFSLRKAVDLLQLENCNLSRGAASTSVSVFVSDCRLRCQGRTNAHVKVTASKLRHNIVVPLRVA